MNIAATIQLTIPPGLERNEVEFYLYDGTLNSLTNGVKDSWCKAPEESIQLIKEDLKENPTALDGLLEMGHKTESEQLQWIYHLNCPPFTTSKCPLRVEV